MSNLTWCKFCKDEVDFKELKAVDFRIIAFIARQMDSHNTVVTTYQNMSNSLELSRRYVIDRVRFLRERGYVATLPSHGSHVSIWLKKGFTHGSIEHRDTLPPYWQMTLPNMDA